MSLEPDYSGVEYVILRDYDDNYAPANSQLRLSLVGDLLFIEIEKPGEGDLKERPTVVGSFGVKLRVVQDSINLLQTHKKRA
jgi:hypothetical protein